MRLRAQSNSSAEHNWLATCETADWAVCATFQTQFMVPMHAKKRKGALHEPDKIRVRARIESGGGPPHSKTLARWPPSLELPPGFGVRRPCGALAMQASQPKAPQDWRSPGRYRAIGPNARSRGRVGFP